MNINLKSLFLGTSLFLIPNITNAQCSPAQSCAELGYKETANKGGCLKCPFGNGWYCPQPKEEKAVLGECTGYAKNCKIGDILNSDGTCTTDKVSGKNPIGIVAYIGGDGCGQALALRDIGSMDWRKWNSGDPDYINTGAFQSYDWQEVIKDYDSCGNTQKITQSGDKNIFPAAWATVNYVPSEAPATKGKWCLPAAGIWSSVYTNLNVIDDTMSKIVGFQFKNNIYIWSSSVWNVNDAWYFSTDEYGAQQKGISRGYEENTRYHVRPVISF